MNEHLKRLKLKESASLDDVKKQYRILSKKYHPDLNPSIDRNIFVELSASYEWLLKNHITGPDNLIFKPNVYKPNSKEPNNWEDYVDIQKPYRSKFADHPNPEFKKHAERLKKDHYKFFRSVSDQRRYSRNSQQSVIIELPIKFLDKDTVIYMMVSPDIEMYLWIDKGTELPYYHKELVGIEIYNIAVDFNPNII